MFFITFWNAREEKHFVSMSFETKSEVVVSLIYVCERFQCIIAMHSQQTLKCLPVLLQQDEDGEKYGISRFSSLCFSEFSVFILAWHSLLTMKYLSILLQQDKDCELFHEQNF